jgi:ribosome-binding protein aMBF1 (putative translation factor)
MLVPVEKINRVIVTGIDTDVCDDCLDAGTEQAKKETKKEEPKC